MPPKFSRFSRDGAEIGPEYFANCISSWKSSGFIPFSVNSEREDIYPGAVEAGMKILRTNRDALDRFGKPYISLGDYLKTATEKFSGPIAFTNADIVLNISVSDFEKIKNLRPGECIIEKRIDVAEKDDKHGIEYALGYDFFVFHSEDLEDFVCDFLFIGLPWWDYYLSVVMFIKGLTSIQIDKSSVVHLLHTERWQKAIWLELGAEFAIEMRRLSITQKSDYFRRLPSKFAPAQLLFLVVKMLKPTHKHLKITLLLAQILVKFFAQTSVKWVDENRSKAAR